jgi:hypothetical protein
VLGLRFHQDIGQTVTIAIVAYSAGENENLPVFERVNHHALFLGAQPVDALLHQLMSGGIADSADSSVSYPFLATARPATHDIKK